MQTILQNGFGMCKITVTIHFHFLSALSREELHPTSRLIDSYGWMGDAQTLRHCQALTAYTTHACIYSSIVGKNKGNFMFPWLWPRREQRTVLVD